MDPPPLKLVMVQGPRKGETLEFVAGSRVRIGRIVRGNNVTIKDDEGISSKHAFIGSESGQWIIRDLDSSNGTILNSSKLAPKTSYPISHGDTIKIGEYTTMLVKIGIAAEEKKKSKPKSQKMKARVTQSRKNLSVDCNKKEDINQSENSVPESSNKEKNTLDLETMTLGQWFDYMEVQIPKQIIEETEMMIEGMREKAQRVDAYMMQQKEKKAKEEREIFNDQ